jgi:hypothetical protein
MAAAAASCQLALASHDQAAPEAFVENLPGGERENELDHGGF